MSTGLSTVIKHASFLFPFICGTLLLIFIKAGKCEEISKIILSQLTLVSLIEGGEVIEGGVFIPANFQ